MNVPTMNPMPSVVPDGEDDSPLDTLIGMGNVALTATALAATDDFADEAAAQAALDNLGFVIPPGGNNCGKGPVVVGGNQIGPFMAADGAGPDGVLGTADDVDGQGAIATDVAHGYSSLLAAYTDLYGNPETADSKGSKQRWQDAVEAHAEAIADGKPQSEITALANAIEPLKDAYDEDLAAFNAISMGMDGPGPVYQAGVNEWMAKAAVTNAIADYNTKVTAANTARADLDGLDYADHVTLRDFASQATLFDADGNPNITNIRTYANLGDGMNAGVQAEDGTISGGSGNFDAAGNLLIPGTGGTATTPFTHVMTPLGVDDIKTRLDNQEELIENLNKARGDNLVGALDEVYEEAIRRAEVELGHLRGQWEAAIADEDLQTVTGRSDDTDTPDVDESMSSIKAEYATFSTADGERRSAETTLRNAVVAREAATESGGRGIPKSAGLLSTVGGPT